MVVVVIVGVVLFVVGVDLVVLVLDVAAAIIVGLRNLTLQLQCQTQAFSLTITKIFCNS